MSLTGKQKAALLLMTLDIPTASELVKGLDQNVVKDLAVEAAYLDAAGYRNSSAGLECVKSFVTSLTAKPEFEVKNFLQQMLNSSVGEQKATQIQNQIGDLLQKKDPFISIRSVNSQTLASVLETEHPQAIAVVLSELPSKKSSEVLGMLHETVRLSAAGRMINCEKITADAKARIAQMICGRIESMSGGDGEGGGAVAAVVSPDASLRKIAIILRNMEGTVREGMLSEIIKKNKEAGDKVVELMVVWDDIPEISDRSMQEGLRSIDAGTLALALVKAEDVIAEKIKSNISERAIATLEEESSLLSKPKSDEINKARAKLLDSLRSMNDAGELSFEEE